MKGTESGLVGRPIDTQKTKQVITAIDQILANEGIAKLSIERIARVAGVSKATLYRRFGTLNDIISSYVETLTDEAISIAVNDIEPVQRDPQVLERLLSELGIQILNLITSPRIIAFDNAMLSAGEDYQAFKLAFYQKGPLNAVNKIADILQQVGAYSPMFSLHVLADMLFHIWRSGVYDRARIYGSRDITSDALAQHIRHGTQLFVSTLSWHRVEAE